MGDRQLVLRYFALKEPNNIRGSMKSMLDRAIKASISEQQGESLKAEYVERLKFLYDLFQGHPFELPADEKGRVRVSAAVYDSSMVAINDLWPQHERMRTVCVLEWLVRSAIRRSTELNYS
jgi:hypothetical protein